MGSLVVVYRNGITQKGAAGRRARGIDLCQRKMDGPLINMEGPRGQFLVWWQYQGRVLLRVLAGQSLVTFA